MSEKLLKKLNLRRAEGADIPLDISPNDVPTLVPEEKMNEITAGDDNPYFKIQSIEFPIVANGWNYTKSFFESYLAKANSRPIPGSKSGHDLNWASRPATDLYLVGGEIKSNGGESGTAILKNYIPPMGDNGSDNSRFIQDNKVGNIDYSLVAYTRDEREELPDGSTRWNVVESIGGERNDAVEFGAGAMEQKTNAQEGDKGEKDVKKETLDALKTLKANGELNFPELAKTLGLDHLIVTDKHKNAVRDFGEVQKLFGDGADVVTEIKSLQANAAKNDEEVLEAKLTNAFGAKGTEKAPNLLYNYAKEKMNGVALNDVEAKINEIKEDPIAKSLAGYNADYRKNNAVVIESANESGLGLDFVE